MNNFENCIPCSVGNGVEPKRTESLTEIMATSKCMGKAALDKVNLIKSHMFGYGRLDGIVESNQMSFMEAAIEHCSDLKALNDELQTIIDLLGCHEK